MLFSKVNAKLRSRLNPLKLFLVRTITVFLVASYRRFAYANGVHPHGELALTGYKFSLGVQSVRAFFVRKISMRSHVMAELERDTFECAGNLVSLSVNPFKLHTNHLTVVCEAPFNTLGAH